MNRPRDAPREFYHISDNGDGTADVYLYPDEAQTASVVRGVEIWDGIEDDVRARYRAWCESAAPL